MGRSIQLLEVTGHCARTSALEAESITGRQIARPAITTRFPARLKETQCLINALIGKVEIGPKTTCTITRLSRNLLNKSFQINKSV